MIYGNSWNTDALSAVLFIIKNNFSSMNILNYNFRNLRHELKKYRITMGGPQKLTPLRYKKEKNSLTSYYDISEQSSKMSTKVNSAKGEFFSTSQPNERKDKSRPEVK